MKTIWKTVLAPQVRQTITIPHGAQFLTAREQHEHMCLWYICDPEARKVEATIVILGTGHEVPADLGELRHIGCAMLEGGTFVFHIFESL